MREVLTPAQLEAEFPLGPDSLPHSGVPRGQVEKFTFSSSRIFPGTVRDYYVYVPAQYDPARAACVMVCQDGCDHIRPERRWQIPAVLDNLIHQQAIPVCIGVFIDPGALPLAKPDAKPRNNRGFEYDSLSDRYVRFLLEEILPEVGRRHHLTQEGGSRLIMGGSSGAICAFNAAWHRPDAFQRVFSCVGSYTAQRGGHTLAALVRLTEPKPIRVFLEGGQADLVNFGGSWWEANLDMLAALRYAGYEVNHAFAEHAGHNDYHGTSIFPDALRWLWRDHPKPVRAGEGSQQPVAHILAPGELWQPVGGDYGDATVLAANPAGEIFFASESDGRIFKVGADGQARVAAGGIDGVSDLAFGLDGSLYACQPRLRRVTAVDETGRTAAVLHDVDAHSACAGTDGSLYLADPAGGQIWLAAAGGARTVVSRGVAAPRCLRLTRDQSQLIVTDGRGRMAYLFAVQPDGGLAAGAPYFRLNLPDEESDCGAGQIAPHPKGWVAFATTLGLQIASLNGSVSALIPPPGPGPATGAAFGRDELCVSCGGRVWRRRILNPDDTWF